MSSVSVRPIPGRQILSRALAYRQMQSNYEPRVRAPVARSRGDALALAWKNARMGARGAPDNFGPMHNIMGIGNYDLRYRAGAGDVPSESEGATNYGTKVSDGGGGGGAVALPAANTGVYASKTVTVIGNPGANLRASANASSQILAGELAGTTLTVVGGPQDGWMNVQDPNGLTGWVYSAYLADATTASGAAEQSATAVSQSPSALGGASGGGLLGLAVVGSAVVAAYYLLIK